MNLPKFSVERKSLVIAAATLAIFWSASSALTMQRREDPDTVQRSTSIVTIWPGATTENVEQLVTKKISDALRGVQHVDHVTGTSRPGVSELRVDFDDVMHDSEAPLRDLRERLDDIRATLPAGITQGPAPVEDFWKTYPIVVGVSGAGLSDRELRDVATNLRDHLGALPVVGKIDLFGTQEQQIAVDVDARKLAAFALTAADVSDAIAAHNAIVPSGTVAIGGRLTQLDPSDGLRGVTDLEALPVGRLAGRIVRVGDVARVHVTSPDPPDEIVRTNGETAVALAIQVKDTASATDLGPAVEAAIARERATWPAGVQARLIANQPQTIDDRIADFFVNLVEGVLVVIALVALLMGVRNGLLVGATIVLSIALTFGIMPFFKVDINQISVLALIIALGIIVDAGIVSIDNIERHLRAGESRREAAWRGVQELWFPLLTSTLVAMSSFIPFGLMSGPTGDFVRSLAIVVPVTLLMSLLVAYFLTPILGEWFAVPASDSNARGPIAYVRGRFDAGLESLQRVYVPVASGAMRRPWLTVGIAFAALFIAAGSIPALGIQFFPSADRNQFFIDITAPDGTDIHTTSRIAHAVEKIVAVEPGVTTYGTFVGQSAPRFYYNVIPVQPEPSFAQMIVDTTDIGAASRAIADIRAAVAQRVAGARIEVKPLEQGPPVGSPIQVRLASTDPALLATLSATLQAKLHGIDGTSSVRDSQGVPTTRLDVRIDRERASAAGVTDAAVQQLLALAYGGSVATQIREADRQTPVVVRLPAELRRDASALGGFAVRAQDGTPVPLDEVATVSLGTQTSVSTLRDGVPTVTVISEVRGRLPSAVLGDFRSAIAGLRLPPGVTLAYAGEDEQTTKSFETLAIAAIVGLLVNQTILLWEFRKLRLSLVVLSAVPLGLIGAVTGLFLTGNHFGFVASLGLSSLGGIVTNHTIVLFEYANREREHDPSLEMDRALLIAGTKRLRPILLTVVTSIAGLLPLAFSTQTLWRPFCWVVIFGLAGSMIMTLVAIPALYRLTEGRPKSRPVEAETEGGSFIPATI